MLHPNGYAYPRLARPIQSTGGEDLADMTQTPDTTQSRLRQAMVELQRAQCALHASCQAVAAAEAELELKQQERQFVALQVAALAERVEALERALEGGLAE